MLQEREVVPLAVIKVLKLIFKSLPRPIWIWSNKWRRAVSAGFILSIEWSAVFTCAAERQDIERIIHKLHRKHRIAPQAICPELLGQLMQHDWPGNLRELDNLMQVACLMAEGDDTLTWQHLPDYLAQKISVRAVKVDPLNAQLLNTQQLNEELPLGEEVKTGQNSASHPLAGKVVVAKLQVATLRRCQLPLRFNRILPRGDL